MSKEISETDKIVNRMMLGKMIYESLSPEMQAVVDARSKMMIDNIKDAADEYLNGDKNRKSRFDERCANNKTREKEQPLTATIGDMLKAKK